MGIEWRKDLIRDAEILENGMIRCGQKFREPVDRGVRERILWGLCKAFYDVILYLVKTDREEPDRAEKAKIMEGLCRAFLDVIRFLLDEDGKRRTDGNYQEKGWDA